MTHLYTKAIVITLFLLASAVSQGQVDTTDTGPMVLSIPRLTALPLYQGQNSDVAMGYLWLDQLMRSSSNTAVVRYLKGMHNVDTAKFLAAAYYRIVDDNPVSFAMWCGGLPGYLGTPGYLRVMLERSLEATLGDRSTVSAILSSEMILHIVATDTLSSITPSAGMKVVLVTAEIIDAIKGQQVPMCPGNMRTGSKGRKPASYRTPIPTGAVPATVNTCVQFEYSPDWTRNGSDIPDIGLLKDTIGDWVRPGNEYIVFLRIWGQGYDSTTNYFLTDAGASGGNNAGIYRVTNGHVEDPYDDFNFGGTNFSVDEWKAKLRARISSIVH